MTPSTGMDSWTLMEAFMALPDRSPRKAHLNCMRASSSMAKLMAMAEHSTPQVKSTRANSSRAKKPSQNELFILDV